MHTFPEILQLNQMDCGPTCLKMVGQYYGASFDLNSIRRLSSTTKNGVSLAGIQKAAELLGFHSYGVRLNFKQLQKIKDLPVIAHYNQNHFVVIYKITDKSVFISDPRYGNRKISNQDFLDNWAINNDGVILILKPNQLNSHYLNDNRANILSYLIANLRTNSSLFFNLGLGMVIALFVQISLPFFTKFIVDYGIAFQDVNLIYVLGLGYLIFISIRIASGYIRDYLLRSISLETGISLVQDFLQKITSFSYIHFNKRNTGDYLRRIYDIDRIKEFVTSGGYFVLYDSVTLLIFFFVLLFFHRTVAAIYLVGLVCFISWYLIFNRHKKRLDNSVFDLEKKEHAHIIQIFKDWLDIRVNDLYTSRKNKLTSILSDNFQNNLEFLKVQKYQQKGGFFIQEILSISILLYSALLVINGSMSFGTMLAIQFIIGSMQSPLSGIGSFIDEYQKANLSYLRLIDIQIDNEIQLNESSLIHPNKITIENLNYSVENLDKPILSNVNINIHQGEVISIIGASGSGKSTLIKLMIGLLPPNNGKIFVGNQNLEHIYPTTWTAHCGIVLQESRVFNETVIYNITGQDNTSLTDFDWLDKILSICRLSNIINDLPHGLYTKIGMEGIHLSGGEKQRIIISRALFKKPQFLFFDEATSALDTNTEKIIIKNILNEFDNTTVIFSTHRKSISEMADRILKLDDGRVVDYNYVLNQQEIQT